MSNSEMSNFCSDQGRTRVCGPRKAGQEGVRLYVAAGNPRRTPSRTKRAIYGWTLDERSKLDIATVIFWIKISVVFYLLTLLAIVDIVRKDFGTIGKKALWGIIAMIPFVGWLIYLIFGFRKGKKPVHVDEDQ